MPRLIDHDAREREIAAAALTVLGRDGLGGMSVRAVATEAGLAVASLRRAFPTQNALRRYCLDLIRARAAGRVARAEGEGRPIVVTVLEELLPLDADRRLELVAQLQLGVLALTDDTLREASAALTADVGSVCRWAIGELERADALPPGSSTDHRAGELHAFLDGLALQALLAPDANPAAAVEKRLNAYLDRLCVS